MPTKKTKIKACKITKLAMQAYWETTCFICCRDNQRPLEIVQLFL
jgi:hypothetical protein